MTFILYKSVVPSTKADPRVLNIFLLELSFVGPLNLRVRMGWSQTCCLSLVCIHFTTRILDILIQLNINIYTSSVIYLLNCKKCNTSYVGSTINVFRTRYCND